MEAKETIKSLKKLKINGIIIGYWFFLYKSFQYEIPEWLITDGIRVWKTYKKEVCFGRSFWGWDFCERFQWNRIRKRWYKTRRFQRYW